MKPKERFFNTAGPNIASDHYTLDPLKRVDWEEISMLIDSKKYFIMHAPRQTGKTSMLLKVMETLNREENYHAVYANIEAAQACRNRVDAGISTVCSAVVGSIDLYLGDLAPRKWLNSEGRDVETEDRLNKLLTEWARSSDRPVVLMLDEVDALVGDTLISLLRQIRAGYAQRPGAFPHSVILCGVRDVRDYRIHTSDHEIITGGSAFNIKSKSLTMGNFTPDEMRRLYAQHTDETGQTFDDGIFAELWEDTAGQPWLVNALGYQMTWENRAARDRSVPITLDMYWNAREELIQSRATHLDQLADKLREERVRRVIAPLLASADMDADFRDDDLQYLDDLGLIRRRPGIQISNRIYREMLPRELTSPTQDSITGQQTAWYVKPDGWLDMPRLLAAFQQFYREHADSWLEKYAFKEAGPQLLLQAFLQRIVNGGGRVNREYGLGRRRVDLLAEWPTDNTQGYFGTVQRIVIELKVLHGSLDATIAEGLEQTADYADRSRADEAHLVIFNRRPNVPWDDKIWHRHDTHGKWAISIWGA